MFITKCVHVSVCVYVCILEHNKRLAYPLSRIPAFIGINKANVSNLAVTRNTVTGTD